MGDDFPDNVGDGDDGGHRLGNEQQTFPAVLHYLQKEWGRFERERATWSHDRLQMQARIGYLEGQRKADVNLKRDLLRRIKMLEYALKQERAKHNPDAQTPMAPFVQDTSSPPDLTKSHQRKKRNQRGKDVLVKYLTEIGYTDSVIHSQAMRMNGMLDDWPPSETSEAPLRPVLMSPQIRASMVRSSAVTDVTNDAGNRSMDLSKAKIKARNKTQKSDDPVAIVAEQNLSEEDALAELAFLDDLAAIQADPEGMMDTNDSNDKPAEDDVNEDEDNEESLAALMEEKFGKKGLKMMKKSKKSKQPMVDNEKGLWAPPDQQPQEKRGGIFDLFGVSKEETTEELDDLGDLANISVEKVVEEPQEVATIEDEGDVKKSWKCKQVLRSHFDSVRASTFHPKETAIATASDDHTIKFWTINLKAKKGHEADPVLTFRGHQSSVLCLAFDHTGKTLYSGGADCTIRQWRVPSADVDKYNPHDSSVKLDCLLGHSDAVWSLSAHPSESTLLSCSADGTCKLWRENKESLSFGAPEEGDQLVVAEILQHDASKAIAAYASGKLFCFDLENGDKIKEFDLSAPDGSLRPNCLATHHTMPLISVGYNDGGVQYFNSSTGKCVHTMIAHQSGVCSMDFDPTGLIALTGGRDRSIRLWDVDTHKCLDEITAHREKHDESILSVAFHRSLPIFSSCGADSIVRIYA